MSKYEELVKKLKEVFQIDKPELDFGVYRILNARSAEINDYLENRLKAKIEEFLSEGGNANSKQVQMELDEAVRNALDLGINPDDVPKVKEIRSKLLGTNADVIENENSVYTHLLTFFSRYYDTGDFVSQRRYKGNTYAIPYSGEEVILHWANKDQYYTKSGENFSNYAFKLDDGRIVRFKLISADTAKDNRKDSDQERRYSLLKEDVRTLLDGEGNEYTQKILPVVEQVNSEGISELILHFEYRIFEKGTKQEEINEKAISQILNHEIVKSSWIELSKRAPSEKNPNRNILEKCLSNYTSKNSSDYFIHRDLGAFLKNELDFYIKNEVMHLDDIQNTKAFSEIEKHLRLIQVFRGIAKEIIDFLAQLEDFQKKLWLKKKFVVSSDYCITLDRVSSEFYPEIISNTKQWDSWKNLGMLEAIPQDKNEALLCLKTHQHMMLETALFESNFKHRLLNSIDNLDEFIDGILINGDNFQGLGLLDRRYDDLINAIYIDPPYNTSASEIAYKNSFKHSSWLSLIQSRLDRTKHLMSKENGLICCTIDDVEQKVLSQLLEDTFGEIAGTVAIRIKPSGRPIPNGFALSHEYAIFARSNPNIAISRLAHSEEQAARYKESDDKGRFFWELFRKAGSNSNRSNRPSMFYPFFYNKSTKSIRLPSAKYNPTTEAFDIEESLGNDDVAIYPIKDDGSEGCWYFGYERAKVHENEFKVEPSDENFFKVYYRRRPNEGVQPTTNWFDSKYSATEHGTALLKSIFGEQELFSYPKSIHAVYDCLSVMGVASNKNAIVLDYFAGSGTTGHAVVNLNREDNGQRKYILVEQGEYFDSVTKPRIQKIVYSADWKEGKPLLNNSGVSHALKILKIESYEDTLNNLQLHRSQEQQDLIKTLGEDFNDDYLLKYMLDIESKGSVVSVNHFNNPFNYQLNIAVDSAGATEKKSIDLVETFNYLIGLTVKHIDYQLTHGFVAVTGIMPNGEKTLVLWRDSEEINYEVLNQLCDKLAINPSDSEYDVVFINGDHNIPSTFTNLETEGGITKTLKIRQIESEFLARMFLEEAI